MSPEGRGREQGTTGNTKPRLLVLTDIARALENDDIQSLARLLLYADCIDIEGLIAVTSTWQRRGARPRHARLVQRLIDAYREVLPTLRVHSPGYPDADALAESVAVGIPAYGAAFGDGFGDARFDDVAGVRAVLRALESPDPRPLWIALWGGANTLAQAVWLVERIHSTADFDAMLAKLRVHAISDQDAAGHWLRDRYGDRLFTIVSPSPAEGGKFYYRATWPGISADRFGHGSPDGQRRGGFPGAQAELVSRRWVRRHIRRGRYGRQYPLHRFIMEGDSPSFLGLIPNGLNVPERPDLGGWGGRYAFRIPEGDRGGRVEQHPIWTDTADTVRGVDGAEHTSPQATIWRWREHFQHDFAARIAWTLASRREDANHAPVVALAHEPRLTAVAGDEVVLDASPSWDPDGDRLRFRWVEYPPAPGPAATLRDTSSPRARARIPETSRGGVHHFVVTVTDEGIPALSAYGRVSVTITQRRR